MLGQSPSLVVLFGPVGPELLIIVGILVLLFGANRIPKLARSVGKSMGSFKKGRQEVEEDLKEIEEETNKAVSDADSAVNDVENTVKEQ